MFGKVFQGEGRLVELGRRCEKVGGFSKYSLFYLYMKLLKKKDLIKKIIDNN